MHQRFEDDDDIENSSPENSQVKPGGKRSLKQEMNTVSTWACPTCTFVNQGGAVKCQMCKTRRVGVGHSGQGIGSSSSGKGALHEADEANESFDYGNDDDDDDDDDEADDDDEEEFEEEEERAPSTNKLKRAAADVFDLTSDNDDDDDDDDDDFEKASKPVRKTPARKKQAASDRGNESDDVHSGDEEDVFAKRDKTVSKKSRTSTGSSRTSKKASVAKVYTPDPTFAELPDFWTVDDVSKKSTSVIKFSSFMMDPTKPKDTKIEARLAKLEKKKKTAKPKRAWTGGGGGGGRGGYGRGKGGGGWRGRGRGRGK